MTLAILYCFFFFLHVLTQNKEILFAFSELLKVICGEICQEAKGELWQKFFVLLQQFPLCLMICLSSDQSYISFEISLTVEIKTMLFCTKFFLHKILPPE